MSELMKGTRVQVTVYGAPRAGRVTVAGRTVVWVQLDGDRCERWFHRESVTLLPPEDPAEAAHYDALAARLKEDGHTCLDDDPIGDAYGVTAPCAACIAERREG